MTKNGEWKVKQEYFQGYMKSSLENIDRTLIKHDAHFEKIYTKLNKQESAIERMKVKWSIVAGGFGAAAAFAYSFIKSMLK